MVTVGDMEENNVLTIGWTGILSTVPPRTYISVRPERHSYKLLKRHGEFVINLTTKEQARVVDYVGIYTGAKLDKFKECGLTRTESREVSAPTIAECPLALECRVVETIPMGSHDVFIADIVSVSCDESMLDRDGKIRFDNAGLLAYAHGEYFALGEKVGKFGFSTKKEKQAKNGKSQGAAKKAPKTTEKASAAKPVDGGSRPPKTAEKTSTAKPVDGGSRPSKTAEKASTAKPVGGGSRPPKTTEKASTAKPVGGGTEEKKPFYLGAPHRRSKGSSKKNIRKK